MGLDVYTWLISRSIDKGTQGNVFQIADKQNVHPQLFPLGNYGLSNEFNTGPYSSHIRSLMMKTPIHRFIYVK